MGAYNTVFSYLAFVVVYHAVGTVLGEVGSLVLSYIPALAHAYWTQRSLVFRPARWLARFGVAPAAAAPRSGGFAEFARFAGASTGIFVANLVFLPLMVRYGDVPAVLAQAIFLIASTIASYLAHKSFSFRTLRRPPS